jgi:hypothetical protein
MKPSSATQSQVTFIDKRGEVYTYKLGNKPVLPPKPNPFVK